MSTYQKVISKSEFEDCLEEQTKKLIYQTIIHYPETIDEIVLENMVSEEVAITDDIWGEYTPQSLAELADTGRFDVYDAIDLQSSAGDIIHSLAWNSVVDTVYEYLTDRLDRLIHLQTIHNYFIALQNLRAPVPDPIDPSNPTDILTTFSTHLRDVHSHDDFLETHADQFTESAFCEVHIRGVSVIDIKHTELIQELYNWLEKLDPDFVDYASEEVEYRYENGITIHNRLPTEF